MKLKMRKVMMIRAGNEATEVAVGSSVRIAVAFPPKNLHIRVIPQHPKVSGRGGVGKCQMTILAFGIFFTRIYPQDFTSLRRRILQLHPHTKNQK